MAEVSCAFLRGECGEGGYDGGAQGVGASGSGVSDERLELGEYHLDGVEVWGIGRQEAQLCAARLDCGAGLGVLVDAEVVAE